MTIISCQELDLEGARSYEESLSEGVVGKRTFLAVSDNDHEFEQNVLSGAYSVGPNPVAGRLEGWPGNPFCLCWKRTPTRNKQDKTRWLLTCDYKTIFNQQEIDRSTEDNPLLRPTRISGSSRTIMIPVRFMQRVGPYTAWGTTPAGIPGTPFSGSGTPNFAMVTAANSAGDPLDPPVEFPQTEWELHCEKNVPTLPAWFGASAGYSDGVNLYDQVVTIQGIPITLVAGTAKLGSFAFSDTRQENGYNFISIQWNVTLRTPRQKIAGSTETSVPGPWDVERLDEGMRTRGKVGNCPCLNGSDTSQWYNIRDTTCTQSISTPIPFNGAGSPITTTGVAIAETSLMRYCYRPCGPRVDYSVIPWS